jgi:hypothetical protein
VFLDHVFCIINFFVFLVHKSMHLTTPPRNCKVQHNIGTGVSVMLGGRADIQECDLRFNKLGPLYGSAPKGSNPFASIATFDGPPPDAPDANDPRAVTVPAPAPGLGLPVWTDYIMQSRNIGITEDGQVRIARRIYYRVSVSNASQHRRLTMRWTRSSLQRMTAAFPSNSFLMQTGACCSLLILNCILVLFFNTPSS